MGGWNIYLYIQEWLKFCGINVGKYSIHEAFFWLHNFYRIVFLDVFGMFLFPCFLLPLKRGTLRSCLNLPCLSPQPKIDELPFTHGRCYQPPTFELPKNEDDDFQVWKLLTNPMDPITF